MKLDKRTDQLHVLAMHHEMLRCHMAFKEFEALATRSILVGESRALAFMMYSAYSSFLHHLYEFMVAAYTRDLKDTSKLRGRNGAKLMEGNITHHINRILSSRRTAIENGTAPTWENSLGYYPETAPSDFASAFCVHRNAASGHTSYKRITLSLTDFYDRYHKFVYLLYQESVERWGRIDGDFPDLGEVTAFSIRVCEDQNQS